MTDESVLTDKALQGENFRLFIEEDQNSLFSNDSVSKQLIPIWKTTAVKNIRVVIAMKIVIFCLSNKLHYYLNNIETSLD
jgi:hypothetical protein